MKARTLIFVLTALVTFSLKTLGEYKTVFLWSGPGFVGYTNFVVEAGVVVEAVRVEMEKDSNSGETVSTVRVKYPDNAGTPGFTKDGGRLAPGAVVVGPALLLLEGRYALFDSDVRWWNFRLTRPTGDVTPSNSVVIPSDEKGPVTIIMETSTDLVNWVQANPGAYGPSTQQRYFRIRAVRQ